MLVPPLPIKNAKMTPKVLQKRERQFSRFLQALGRAEEIKASKFFIAFLSLADLKEFTNAVKHFEKVKYDKSLSSLVTAAG